MASAIASDLPRRARLGAALLAAIALLARAQPARGEATEADKVAAEALFDQAKVLAKQGHFSDACPKFAESQRLDPGIGTMLYLADCYEQIGRTASAWAQFREAAAAAKAGNQPEREKIARDRVAALEARLSRLSVTVPIEAQAPGLVVTRDATPLGPALWGTPIPVDPGEHTITATAPGKKKWSATVVIKSGDTTPIAAAVPPLEVDPIAATPVEPPKQEPPKQEPPKQEPPKQEAPGQPPAKREFAGRPAPRDVPPPNKPTNAGQIAGGVLTGVGGAGLAVGGVVGMVAMLKNSDSNNNCKPSNACNLVGIDQRKSALGLATVSNITLIAGGAVFTAGIITLFATRDSSGHESMVLKASPLIADRTGGFVVGGRW
jgi:hypothetical protein